jgi:hypothetical protein
MWNSARTHALTLSACLLLTAAPAAAWKVRADAPRAEFRAFNRRFAADAYAWPRHGAAPLGITGFDVYADADYDPDFDDQPFTDDVIDGDLTGGFLAVGRVGARKGLPLGIDLGLSYGRALGGDVGLASAEIQYALFSGGVLSPALSVRVTGTRTVDSGAYDLDQYGAELLASKGFPVVTIYSGGGIVRSQGTLHGSLDRIRETDTRGVFYAGATLSLLVPKITFEFERAESLQGAVRVGFGF